MNVFVNQNDKIARDAINASSEKYPESILAILVLEFEPIIVIKLLKLFSGQRIWFPRFETILKNYQNKVISDTLAVKNNKVIREQLSLFFGISENQIQKIFNREKCNVKILKDKTVRKAVKADYRLKSDDFTSKTFGELSKLYRRNK